MYSPASFQETRLEVLHALMRAHPFATLIVFDPSEGPAVEHIPLLLDPEGAPCGMLRGHVARANPVWRTLAAADSCMAVFAGPTAYVSPTWYPSKQSSGGKVVPTWNYAIVHAHCQPRVIHDPDWLLRHVGLLTDAHEGARVSGRDDPAWRVSDAPGDYIDKLLGAIVGIELHIARLEGKFKLSQNRPAADRQGTLEGLEALDSDAAAALAAFMREHTPLT